MARPELRTHGVGIEGQKSKIAETVEDPCDLVKRNVVQIGRVADAVRCEGGHQHDRMATHALVAVGNAHRHRNELECVIGVVVLGHRERIADELLKYVPGAASTLRIRKAGLIQPAKYVQGLLIMFQEPGPVDNADKPGLVDLEGHADACGMARDVGWM